ncbi:MAG: tripartite tricarboxylate transporter TctB family protein [Candidatus Heteroscillospira sp.]|jgi:putative tricarboxylic transport membrane protein
MNKRFSIVREVWLGLGLVGFSLFFLQQSSNLNARAQQYPKIILSVLLVLSAALLIQGVYYSFKPENYQKRYGKSTKSIEWGVVTKPLFVFGTTVIYLILFYYINFFVATAVFVPAIMFLFGQRKVLPILLTTVGLELFVYLVFVLLLKVYFPM